FDDAENKTPRSFHYGRHQRKSGHRRRRHLPAKMHKRRVDLVDFSLRFAQEVAAHHRKARALVDRSLDRQKSPDNVRAIPTHGKTATNRYKEPDHSARLQLSHEHALPETLVSEEHN